MDERILKWLYDIQGAIDEIENYFKDNPKEFNQYRGNIILKRAIERDLEIAHQEITALKIRSVDRFEKRYKHSGGPSGPSFFYASRRLKISGMDEYAKSFR